MERQIKVGVGITTYNRPECLKECLQHICDYSDVGALDGMSKKDYWFGRTSDGKDITIYVATDTNKDRKGVAFRKNECLRALKDCDYVFLFDDDCYPIKDGWIDNFIKHPYGHLLYCNKNLHRLYMEASDGSDIFLDCGGVFMFMTKDVIDRVGAFNEKFELYGFEHPEYSLRYCRAVEYPIQFAYQSLANTKEYIFAHDYSTPNHKSSITDEEKNKHVKNNWDKFFNEPIKEIYLPL